MFKLQELSNLIESQLNSAGENFSPAYSFRIFTEIGKNTGNSYINCVLRQQRPTISVVPGVINNSYSLVLDVVVPANTVNFNLANVQEIFNNVIDDINGKEQEFKDGNAIVTFTLANTGTFKTEYGQGNIVPISYNIFVNYGENVVLTKHYLLDNVEIPFTYDELLLEKDGVTKPIYGENFEKSFVTLQRKVYHFRMPKETTLATTLLKDMLQDSMNKEYTLKFYDGVTFTQAEPYTTKVSIFRTGNAKSERPQTTELDIMFADVDDSSSNTAYELALIDNKFDADSENTRYFASQQTQQAYYESLVANGGATWDRIKVPNLNSIDLTNQIYKNTSGYDLFDLVNKNYAIIRVTQTIEQEDDDPIVNKTYFYYKVTNANIGLENQVAYDLQLDTLQTYYFNENIEFAGTFINKAHLDRWIDNGDGTISFNGVADSDLFEREEIKQVAKRLIALEKLKYTTENNDLKDLLKFFSDNILCWVYISLSKGEYTVSDTSNVPFDSTKTSDNYYEYLYPIEADRTNTIKNPSLIDYGVSVICYPIYKFERRGSIIPPYRGLYFSDGQQPGTYSIWCQSSFLKFLEDNDGYSYVKSIRLSLKYPLYFDTKYINDINASILPKYHINYSSQSEQSSVFFTYNPTTKYLIARDSDISAINNRDISANEVIVNGTYEQREATINAAFLKINYDNPNEILFKLDLNEYYKNTFNKTELNTANLDKKYNPKLTAVDYKELHIKFLGSEQIFDLQKINTPVMTFSYKEMITPDNSKILVRYISKDENAIFIPKYSKSINGLLITNDLSLPIANNQLDTYLANNKNAYLSFQNQQTLSTAMWTADTTTGFAKALQNPLSIFGFGADAAGSALKQGIQLAYNQAQFDLSLDNMKNAPESLSNANGNAIFGLAVSFELVAEIYEGLNAELEIANDIMHQNGFTYNRYGNVKNFDNIRKYFNYVQAVIGNIGGIAISQNARNDLRQRFINGVRFWNTDNIDYSVENIEKSIELVYNMRYTNENTDKCIIVYQPEQIHYGIFKTQLALQNGYSYSDFDISFEVNLTGLAETTLTNGITFNQTTGEIELDLTNSNNNSYFKESLTENKYIKLVITYIE